jgi:hypothetical protein
MKRLLYILFPILAFGIFNSCNKQNINDLQGSWELLSKPNGSSYDYRWTFKGTQAYIEATDNNDPYDGRFDTCAIGNFFVKNGVLTIATVSSFCSYSAHSGDWDLQKLDSQGLTIRQSTENGNMGAVWYEFRKIVD